MLGDGPADSGPVLLGVKLSFRSSCPSCRDELARLLWLLFMFESWPWLACPRAYSPPPISADDADSMVPGRRSSSRDSVSRIVARLLDCWSGAKGVKGLAGESCGGGGSGKGFARLSCRLRLRAWCAGAGGRVLLGGKGAEAADFSSAGAFDSVGRRRDSLDGLPGVIFLMPRKAEDMISEGDLEGRRSSDSESEGRPR
jgi:hypothetical protein